MFINIKKIKTAKLSGKGWHIRPAYNKAGIPQTTAPSDHEFRPGIDTESTLPKVVARIRDKEKFSRRYFQSINVYIPLKAPQSDIYYLPEEVGQHYECVQKIANLEHRRTAAAFTRAAWLAVRQYTELTAEYWHYDIGANVSNNRDKDTPTITYNCSDIPTEAVVRLFPADDPRVIDYLERQKMNPEIKQNPYRLMVNMTSRQGDRGTRIIVPAQDIVTASPYDITRHNDRTDHRAPLKRDRTLVSIFYIELHRKIDFSENPMMAGLRQAKSAAAAESPELLQRYMLKLEPML